MKQKSRHLPLKQKEEIRHIEIKEGGSPGEYEKDNSRSGDGWDVEQVCDEDEPEVPDEEDGEEEVVGGGWEVGFRGVLFLELAVFVAEEREC